MIRRKQRKIIKEFLGRMKALAKMLVLFLVIKVKLLKLHIALLGYI